MTETTTGYGPAKMTIEYSHPNFGSTKSSITLEHPKADVGSTSGFPQLHARKHDGTIGSVQIMPADNATWCIEGRTDNLAIKFHLIDENGETVFDNR